MMTQRQIGGLHIESIPVLRTRATAELLRGANALIWPIALAAAVETLAAGSLPAWTTNLILAIALGSCILFSARGLRIYWHAHRNRKDVSKHLQRAFEALSKRGFAAPGEVAGYIMLSDRDGTDASGLIYDPESRQVACLTDDRTDVRPAPNASLRRLPSHPDWAEFRIDDEARALATVPVQAFAHTLALTDGSAGQSS